MVPCQFREEEFCIMTAKLPSAAGKVAEKYPDVWKAYEQFGAACAAAGLWTSVLGGS